MFCLLYYWIFSKFLATKCIFLDAEPCMVGHPLIDMNPNELKFIHD